MPTIDLSYMQQLHDDPEFFRDQVMKLIMGKELGIQHPTINKINNDQKGVDHDKIR